MDYKSEKKSSSAANSAVLSQNGMRYKMPMPLSTSLIRTYKKQYSQRSSYSPGDTIVWDLNCSGLIDPEISYLRMDVNVAGANTTFGAHGTALNLVRDLRIQSKNGVELDRIQHLNAYSHMWINNNVDSDTLSDHGAIAGFGQAQVAGTASTYCVPLPWLSGFFRPHVKGQKIPPHLLSGARIEIQLEAFGRALFGVGATGYTITNAEFVFMEHTPNDNTLKVLTEESANNGLEYVYDRIFTAVETSSDTTVNIQIKKAVSQATSVVTTLHDPSTATAVASDSLISLTLANAFDTSSNFQYRIASNYFPHQRVDNQQEAFIVSKSTHDMDKDSANKSGLSYVNWISDMFSVSVPLKTDNGISSSGMAVNNSATLSLEYTGTAGQNKTYYTFLTYTALARSFLAQTTVKI